MKIDAADAFGIIVVFFVIAAFVFMMGFVSGAGKATADVREEARKAGAGEYYLDENQDKKFRFIKCELPHKEE